jgi:hypothetical protein
VTPNADYVCQRRRPQRTPCQKCTGGSRRVSGAVGSGHPRKRHGSTMTPNADLGRQLCEAWPVVTVSMWVNGDMADLLVKQYHLAPNVGSVTP